MAGWFYNKDGKPITDQQWMACFAQEPYKRVGLDEFGPYTVSTVWLGIDHGFGRGALPLIFETMVFGPGGHSDEREQVRVATLAEAKATHAAMVEEYRKRAEDEAPAVPDPKGFEFL